jgi:ATP-dependent DNA ligase
MRRLSKNDEESELSIYDVNLFLRYLCALEGTGSATEKAQKIISFGSNASVLEGIFLLKLIERKLTIGASNKTFRKANQRVDEEDTPK